MTNLKIIQGDSYCLEVAVESLDLELVNKIYFSSKVLSICKELTYDSDNNVYLFELTPSETEKLMPCETTYDLTFHFVGDVCNTVQYNSSITILPKRNKVVCIE